MDSKQQGTIILLILFGILIVFSSVSSAPKGFAAHQQPTPTDRPATEEELAKAEEAWRLSEHSDTYDDGMGANTTCARCKSPMNWDPIAPGVEAAMDCYSCKRVPGAERPILQEGNPVSREEWNDITCDVCHIPINDSYSVGIAYWNQSSLEYEDVESVVELCAKCHEGQHGFRVVEEQFQSSIHSGWECTECHGTHGTPSACEDCHDPQDVSGAEEHERHPSVNCTACHDAGALTIIQDQDPNSRHFEEYIPVRFAHTLTSWPSHNLSTEIYCQRCHHPTRTGNPAVDTITSCQACHPEGVMWIWCEAFERDADPNH